jgi:hypothetical protein
MDPLALVEVPGYSVLWASASGGGDGSGMEGS